MPGDDWDEDDIAGLPTEPWGPEDVATLPPVPDAVALPRRYFMLVLTRFENEAIVIGDDITVRVVSIDRGKVRLGVIVPREVKVLREEDRRAD